jgi:hypothetical protein
MNKIEEILKNKGITSTTKFHNYDYLYNSIKESIEEFGKICFEAARKGKYADKHAMYGGNCYYNIYNTYEDFLKEIKDETGN